MGERQASSVIDEWRALERRLADGGADEIERTQLRWRISELRVEYQALTESAKALLAAHEDATDPADERPVVGPPR